MGRQIVGPRIHRGGSLQYDVRQQARRGRRHDHAVAVVSGIDVEPADLGVTADVRHAGGRTGPQPGPSRRYDKTAWFRTGMERLGQSPFE